MLIRSFFGAPVAAFASNVPHTLEATVLAVQVWIAATFYLFILVTSNPFLRLALASSDGRDSIRYCRTRAIHPPLLYLVFSISFCFAVRALIEGRIVAPGPGHGH